MLKLKEIYNQQFKKAQSFQSKDAMMKSKNKMVEKHVKMIELLIFGYKM